MPNFILQANLNVLSGRLSGVMHFKPGLNLIGGENGTCKTKLLQQLKSGAAIPQDPSNPLRIQAISPKRNSERRAAEQIWQVFRQQNRTLDALLNERVQAQINDAAFENYPSLGDLFYLVFDDRAKDGGDRREHMLAVTKEFNGVIQSVFDHYELVSEWDAQSGAPRIRIRKNNTVDFPIEGLSLGEQEILGLVASLHASRKSVDVYLIDEPEVHLNWHLEEKLFAFLDDLCESHAKQAIVVTHSRAMFTSRYIHKAQFLRWEAGRIRWGAQLTTEQKRRIAGEAIEIIKLGSFGRPTFFVEDAAHVRILEALSKCFGVSVTVTECGNSPNVKSLFRLSKLEGGWRHSTFLVDGDNEGNPYPGEPGFVHLSTYCADNLVLHPVHLASSFGKTIPEVQSLLAEAIVGRRHQILKKNRFLDFLLDRLTPGDLTFEHLSKLDGSEILDDVADRLSVSASELVNRVVSHLHASGALEQVFPPQIIETFKSAAALGNEPEVPVEFPPTDV